MNSEEPGGIDQIGRAVRGFEIANERATAPAVGTVNGRKAFSRVRENTSAGKKNRQATF